MFTLARELVGPSWLNEYQNFTSCNFSGILYRLLSTFKKSCQPPQLVEVTAVCVLTTLEVVVHKYHDNGKEDPKCLTILDQALAQLSDNDTSGNIAASPVAKLMNRKFQKRIANIRDQIMYHYYDPYRHHMICSLLSHCYCDVV